MATSRIPIQVGQQRQSLQLGMPAARVPMVAVDDQRGRAVGGLAAGLGQIGTASERLQREQDTAWVSKAASDDQIKWLQRLNELQEAAAPGAPGFTPSMIKEFDDYSAQALENAPENARPFYREQLIRQRTYLGQRAVEFEARSQRNFITSQYQAGMESDAATIALDPAQYQERRAARVAALQTSSLPDAVKAKLLGESEAALAYAAGAATIDRNPRGAMSAFEAASRGEAMPAGFDWIRQLDSDRIQQLRTRAHTQTDRLDTRDRVEADRIQARAGRALGEMDKQIASGLPPKTEDMVRWAGMTMGTEFEAGYRERMAGFEDVQKVLRMPPADQQAFIERRRVELERGGGNSTDKANLDRLEKAVEADGALRRDQPLSWIARRAGVAFPTLDMRLLSTPDGAVQIGPVLRDRADAIRGLQSSHPPGAVNMHPLPPAEAEQLTETFKAASPREKQRMLGNLYWAAGEHDTYQGIMDQIDGADPFLARLGRLSGSLEEGKLQGNWFSPDVLQSAGDVVATAIAGDEILKAGGKAGSLSYPLPKDDEFTQAIADQVGDLYRGVAAGDSSASQFLHDAYAVKAYYLGRAAQEGDLSPDVNSDRLSQAITAVLGQTVDFHGNGRVQAPWGMSESDFMARANMAVFRELNARGMQEKMGRSMSSVGLIGVGAGAYALTLGGMPVLDPQSKDLVIIAMTPDNDAGRDEFGGQLGDLIPNPAADAMVGGQQ